jgi:hypothetical protein
MRFRDLLRGGDGAPPPPTTPVPASTGLTRVRRDAQELLSAGDEAIARALSGDSQAFLRANRQQGGQ